MTNILFVCTANQFRSPIAASYFAHRLKETGEPGEWQVFSAGTWTVNGLPAHPKAVTAAAQLGLNLNKHKTREVTAKMLSDADLIIVMEQGQKEALECEFTDCIGRIVLMGELAGEHESEILDPARTDFEDGDAIVRSIVACIDKGFVKLLDLTRPHSGTQCIQSVSDPVEKDARLAGLC